jgi:hypothetical protein
VIGLSFGANSVPTGLGDYQEAGETVAIPAVVPRIDFRVHQIRTNYQGAREEFEQMIALLVERLEGDARRVLRRTSW